MSEHTKEETALAEDASDIEAFEAREKEPDYALEDVVEDLKRRSKIYPAAREPDSSQQPPL